MAELNQQLSVNGTALSNKDPDLVIKLDDHPVVQISSIQESTITYAFLSDVDTAQVYNLNLTFTYKGTLTKVVPLTFKHNPKPVPLVITDTPITAAMWERGDAIPFTAQLDGVDVTSQLSSIALVPNDYIKADPTPGSDKKRWSVESAEPTPADALTKFNFNFTYEGKVKALSAEGTFKLPAWDGLMMWVIPTTENDPLFSNIRVKVGSSVTVNVMPKFRGGNAYDNSASYMSVKHNDTNDGMVEFSDGTGHWSIGRPLTVKGLKVGTHKVKLALASSVTYGYPAEDVGSTMTYWEPTVEVYDDVLAASSTDTEVSGAKGDDVTFNLAVEWNGAPIDTNAAGVTLTLDRDDVMTIKSRTANSVTATLIKDVEYTRVIPVTVNVAYQGKTTSVVMNVKVINEVLTVTIDPENTIGGTNDTFTIKPTIVYNGVTQKVNDPELTLVVTPDTMLQVVETTEDSITIKVTNDDIEATEFIAQLMVSKGSLQAIGPWMHKYTVRPSLVMRSVSGLIKDSGPAPFSFTIDGPAVEPTSVSATLSENDYVTVDSSGAWTIIKAEDTATEITPTYTITIEYDGVTYTYVKEATFNIGPLGSTVTATPVVKTSDMVLNKESQVSFTLTQQLAGSAVSLTPQFENMTIEGEATYVDVQPHPDNANEYVVTVKGTGKVGAYKLKGRFRNVIDGTPEAGVSYPFSVDFTAAKLASSTVTMSAVGGTVLTPVQQNTLTVALKYGSGNSVVGATPRDVTIVAVPNSDAILAGFETTLTPVDGQPGSYTLSVDVGHKAGSIRVNLIVVIDGAQYVVDNALVYTTPGADVLATPIVSEFNATDDATSELEFSLAQSRLDVPSYNFTGASFKDVVGIGEIKSVSAPTVGNEGTFFITVTGNGTAGSGTIGGTVVDVDGNEFAFDFDVTGVIPSDDFAIRVTPLTTELTPASSNPILFVLKDQYGTPITDATKVSMDIVENPNYRNVLAGYSNTLINMNDTNPGQYRLGMNLGETAGTFTISLTVAVPGKAESYTLPDMVFTNPGSPIKTALSPNTIDVGAGKTSVVTLTLTRDKYLVPDAQMEGIFHVVSTTGPVTALTPSLVQNSNGTIELTFTSDGTQGEIEVNAEFAPVVNDITWDAVPFTFKLSTAVPSEPVVTEPTTEMSLQLWEQKPISFNVMAGDTDLTADASVSFAGEATDYLEFVSISNGVWGFKAIKADSVEDTVIATKVNVTVNFEDNDYTLPIDINVTVLANTGDIPSSRFNIEIL